PTALVAAPGRVDARVVDPALRERLGPAAPPRRRSRPDRIAPRAGVSAPDDRALLVEDELEVVLRLLALGVVLHGRAEIVGGLGEQRPGALGVVVLRDSQPVAGPQREHPAGHDVRLRP